MELKYILIGLLMMEGFGTSAFAVPSISTPEYSITCEARLPYNDSQKMILNYQSLAPKTVFIPGTQILLTSKISSKTGELCLETTSTVELLASVCGASKELTLMTKTDADGLITIKCRQN